MIIAGCCTGLATPDIMPPIKYQEIVANKLSAADFTWAIAAPLHVTAGAMSNLFHISPRRKPSPESNFYLDDLFAVHLISPYQCEPPNVP